MLRCWWCTLEIITPVVKCPIRQENNNLIAIGNFCSLSCVKSFAIKESYIDPVYADSVRLLQLFNTITIQPALGPYVLRQYGGYMNSDEFKSYLNF
ncbi:VLTF2-like late transcription factor [Lymphocystis disease virus 1]|uniref:VLTF2-like late transcription factor n=1 Tax=Fish lymphocystis disease virus TaxID=36363 RepID=UPI0000161EFB|nr:VLTF2-like late transcription factor [Lymphocystis disease virus 1]